MAIASPDDSFLIGGATSSVLVKRIAKCGKAYVVSSEIHDVLSKLLKSDDETASGDIQLSYSVNCFLWKEQLTTKAPKKFEKYQPIHHLQSLSVLIQNGAKYNCTNGSLCNFGRPLCNFGFLVLSQLHDANRYIETEATDNFDEICQVIQDFHENNIHIRRRRATNPEGDE